MKKICGFVALEFVKICHEHVISQKHSTCQHISTKNSLKNIVATEVPGLRQDYHPMFLHTTFLKLMKKLAHLGSSMEVDGSKFQNLKKNKMILNNNLYHYSMLLSLYFHFDRFM